MMQLAGNKRADLKRLERTIEQGLRTFREVGAALLTIRDQRLYEPKYASFDEYCRQRWQFSLRRAQQLIAAASEASDDANNCSPLTCEAQVREVKAVPPEQRPAVIEAASQATGGKPTAAALKQAAKEILQQPSLRASAAPREPDPDEEDISRGDAEHLEEPLPKDQKDWLAAAAEELCFACGNRQLVAEFLDGVADLVHRKGPAVAMARLQNAAQTMWNQLNR
jgi:hypothetical protein